MATKTKLDDCDDSNSRIILKPPPVNHLSLPPDFYIYVDNNYGS